jgi:hypothetical protein
LVTPRQVIDYLKQRFDEDDPSDRIEDRGFAYYINSQPRAFLESGNRDKMTFGNGPLVILKETGDVYRFSSSPIHMFGNRETRIGVNGAKTKGEFDLALGDLAANRSDGTTPRPITRL